jgi:mitochondrial fission protein ELM1
MDQLERLPPDTRIRVLASSKAGHVVPCIGLARQLGIEPDICPVRPRRLYAALAPWGPADPHDSASTSPPWPNIAIASARETVPVLRKLKRASGDRVFTVFLGDPRAGRSVFDMIWAPQHDGICGPNIVSTLTAPHPHGELKYGIKALEEAGEAADPRLSSLPQPRVTCLIGGPNSRFSFGPDDIARTCKALEDLLTQGASLMVSPSRRTPRLMVERLLSLAQASPQRMVLWHGTGENPYRQMLALADAFLVTSDSVNMIGEALATGKPVHFLKLAGDPGKFARFYEGLHHGDLAREWSGALEQWQTKPFDSTPLIAAELLRRYAEFRQRLK